MTPKVKAEELFNKFINYSQQCINDEIINQFNLENPTYKGSKFVAMMRFSEKYNAKQCALIAINELIEFTQYCSEFGGEILGDTKEYWEIVKQEIENL